MELLKDRFFNPTVYAQLTEDLAHAYPQLDKNGFFKALTAELDTLELKQRLQRTVETFHQFLPDDFRSAVEILKEVAPKLSDFTGIAVADYVGAYGQSDFDYSLDALHYVTQFASAEFAIREFLRTDFDRTLERIIDWSCDDNEHVRRLASEGTRPRLPWSFQLKRLILNPAAVRPILENLKSDPSLYVRKSVANHLNDISKDNPETMLDWLSTWDQSHAHTHWIVKRGTRTLIKAAHPAAFQLRGFTAEPQIHTTDVSLSSQVVPFGGEAKFTFVLISTGNKSQKLAVDYSIHYVKKNGSLSAKVFKLKELILAPNESVRFTKSVDFQQRSTRKHYPGQHRIDILVNGTVVQSGLIKLDTP